MWDLMCIDLDSARRSREKIKERVGDRFWNEQTRIAAQWELSGKKPKGLIMRELPYVGISQIRLDRDTTLSVY